MINKDRIFIAFGLIGCIIFMCFSFKSNAGNTSKFHVGEIVKPTYSDKKGYITEFQCIRGTNYYRLHIDGFYDSDPDTYFIHKNCVFMEDELESVKDK